VREDTCKAWHGGGSEQHLGMSRTTPLNKRARVAFAAALGFEIAAGASRLCAQQMGFALEHPPTALTLCQEADQRSGDERQRVLLRGLELAEAAVAADPHDAKAHFAVFCNLGKQLQSHRPGPHDLMAVGRLKREIDTALALAPGDSDLLAAKGTLLLALPWFLGGDARQGKGLLRATLVKDPDNAVARHYLSK
jgi:hypothetical protein